MSVRIDLLGDTQISRPEPETAFERLTPLMADADLRLCQLEATISEKGEVRSDVQNPAHRVPPRMVDGLVAGGIDAVTFAGNNNVDYGPEAMFDTVDRLSDHGIEAVGVGENVDDARAPLYLEAGEATVAIVNVCSILRSGYAATETRPGLSPLRVSTFYETLENEYEQPATPGRTVSVPNRRDMNALTDRIAEANEFADYVLACIHAGVHFTYDLAMYQPDVAYEAIEAGADAVIGTHPHNLQAVDVHQEKPIFYSLGNIVFDQPEEHAAESVTQGYLQYYGMDPESGATNYPHPRHTRDTMLVHLTLSESGVDFELQPVRINERATPEPVFEGDAAAERIADLLQALSGEIGVDLSYQAGTLSLAGTKERDTRQWVRDRTQSYPWLAKLQLTEYDDNPLSLTDVL